jgi:hypothetical protein
MKAPSSKHQDPEQHQAPNPTRCGLTWLVFWDLELLWMLVLGVWSFPPGLFLAGIAHD